MQLISVFAIAVTLTTATAAFAKPPGTQGNDQERAACSSGRAAVLQGIGEGRQQLRRLRNSQLPANQSAENQRRLPSKCSQATANRSLGAGPRGSP